MVMPDGQPASVQNRSRADEADAGNDLRRDPRRSPKERRPGAAERTVNIAAPKQMNMFVRKPAGR